MFKNTQTKMNEIEGMHKVVIFNEKYEVQAPLPNDFGMTVGSEYSQPFDAGGLSGGWQKTFAVAGVSQKAGISVRKLFTNPEPTEISFEMEFNAYYSAADEVLIPVFCLTQMTLGSRIQFSDLEEGARNFLKKIANAAATAGSFVGINAKVPDKSLDASAGGGKVEEISNTALNLLQFVQSPDYVTLKFGNTMKWRNMYITSCAVTFSNILDSNGLPMSAKCAITATPELYPTADDMHGPNGIFEGALRG